jgi:hypothetical protein
MARMATGVARQDFSPISNINYDTLAQFKQAGLERVYQSDAAKQDRFRQGLKEAEQNRMIQSQTTGAIGGLLQSNPNLLTGIQEGDAPESVKKAYKSFERGGGSLESNALLANYLSTTDAGQKQAQELAFKQANTALATRTALANAEARRLSALNEQSKPKPVSFTPEGLEEFKAKNPNLDFAVKPVVVNGEVRFEAGASRAGTSAGDGTIYSLDEIQKLESDSGMTFTKTPARRPDGSQGFMLGKSYAPESKGIDVFNKFQMETAESFQDDARFWLSDRTQPRLRAKNNLAVYEDALTQLESGGVVVGDTKEKMLGLLAGIGLDDPIRAFINPDSQDLYDNVRSVVFLGLRETLGAQFTENEGNRLVRASYNPSLSPQQNAKRLRRMADLLRDTIEYKDMLSDMALSEEGIVSLVKGTQQGISSYLDSQIDIFEAEYNQDALLQGLPTIPTGRDKPKAPISHPQDVQDILNQYSTEPNKLI